MLKYVCFRTEAIIKLSHFKKKGYQMFSDLISMLVPRSARNLSCEQGNWWHVKKLIVDINFTYKHPRRNTRNWKKKKKYMYKSIDQYIMRHQLETDIITRKYENIKWNIFNKSCLMSLKKKLPTENRRSEKKLGPSADVTTPE